MCAATVQQPCSNPSKHLLKGREKLQSVNTAICKISADSRDVERSNSPPFCPAEGLGVRPPSAPLITVANLQLTHGEESRLRSSSEAPRLKTRYCNTFSRARVALFCGVVTIGSIGVFRSKARSPADARDGGILRCLKAARVKFIADSSSPATLIGRCRTKGKLSGTSSEGEEEVDGAGHR